MAGMQSKKTQIINAAFVRQNGRLIVSEGNDPVYAEVSLWLLLSMIYIYMSCLFGVQNLQRKMRLIIFGSPNLPHRSSLPCECVDEEACGLPT